MAKPDDVPQDVWDEALRQWRIGRGFGAIDIIARAILAERERCAEIAALFVHRRLYKPNFPACSYHSKDIHKAIMEVTKEEIEAARPQRPSDQNGQSLA